MKNGWWAVAALMVGACVPIPGTTSTTSTTTGGAGGHTTASSSSSGTGGTATASSSTTTTSTTTTSTSSTSSCTDTMTDPKNCGTCGHDCQGGSCATGMCQPLIPCDEAGVVAKPRIGLRFSSRRRAPAG